MIASAVLLAGCQSMSGTVHYPDAVDACKLPGPDILKQLAPGTVEIPAGSIKTVDTRVVPEDRSSAGNELTSCKRLFARDLGGGKPNLQDYRIVTIAVVRFTASDAAEASAKATQLMTDALGDHSGVRLATGVGDEAGFSEQWAAVRTGNVVLGLAIADGGTEAALIPPATLDNVQAMVTDMTGTLRRDYQG
ncbi:MULTISPECIES: hypothetical protein [unclassified Amycolatopsis]|uniref:hypothetical protein n=1 Tax=unclassified Amycolatopsis TaxID=2618356 RepID=UPI002E14EA3D|nr:MULTISPECIES: hypothetical protein [unclassified Amycolatopsis]WSJ72841.1 hypothetical protein OG439_25445 [Amycolatopsis sp. NBC_01307]WSK83437.1 hypothetical protein OG570_23850 [Amycolatopsis sp. NBC_01286]